MRAEKKQLVDGIGQLIQSSAHLFLVNYKGLAVKQFGALRAALAKHDAECHVVPNRLLKIALTEAGVDCFGRARFVGALALVTGGTDPVAVAKALRQCAIELAPLELNVGVLEGRYLQSAEVEQLAKLPSREILLAQLLGVLEAPARQLVGVLNAKSASIVYALQAYLDSKQTA